MWCVPNCSTPFNTPTINEKKEVRPLYSVYSLTVMTQTRPHKQTKISVMYLYIILKMVLFHNKQTKNQPRMYSNSRLRIHGFKIIIIKSDSTLSSEWNKHEYKVNQIEDRVCECVSLCVCVEGGGGGRNRQIDKHRERQRHRETDRQRSERGRETETHMTNRLRDTETQRDQWFEPKQQIFWLIQNFTKLNGQLSHQAGLQCCPSSCE